MSKSLVRREAWIAWCLAGFLAIVPATEAATTTLPSAPQPQTTETQAAPAVAAQQNNGQSRGPNAEQSQQTPQTAPANQQTPATQPVGTAAAPYIKPEGVPASRPAGAAIAPAKQRRIRQIAIRVGLLVGAGIAIGTVAAASLGSPARPH
jgi:hypothetical protein